MSIPTPWLLTPERIALHLPTGTAVQADLHLGYGETRRRGGEAVPTIGLEETLAPLGAVCSRQKVHRLVVAGDFLEAVLPYGLAERFVEVLTSFRVELVGIVPGNHDRRLASADLPLVPQGVTLGDWLVVHGDGMLPAGKIVQGHVHPCLRPSCGQSAVCYLVHERRIVLPAFSGDAAGTNVLSRLDWNDFECHAIAGDRVLDFGLVKELRKKLRRRSCRG